MMNRKDLLHSFRVEKDYDSLKSKFKNSKDASELEVLAEIYLGEQDFEKAFEIYKKLEMKYEMGRCKLLLGDLGAAKSIWDKIEKQTPATLWGGSLIQFIERYVVDLPTFFQIRSFLEVDLYDLLQAKQYEFCENIINGADIMAQSNSECYKFIGRVFVNSSLPDVAKVFLEKAKNACYMDPEVHFLLAKCYMDNNNIARAKESLKTCLEKAPEYFPAKKLLEKLS